MHTEIHPTRKITAHLPITLLEDAQHLTGAGVTETLRQALEHLARGRVYTELKNLRGSYRSSLNLKELRKDKGET